MINVIMSDKIERVEKSAFFECAIIKFVRLTANVKYIGARAFDSCEKLEMILYCSNKNDVDWSEGDPFPTDPTIYLFYDFPGGLFCGHACFPILDHECNIPTQSFTEYISDSMPARLRAILPIFFPVVMPGYI